MAVKKIVLFLMVLLTFSSVLADDNGTSTGIDMSTENFNPLVWMCDNRIMYDDYVEWGRTSMGGENLIERNNNYAFEGEQIEWTTLVMDKNGIEKIDDVFVSLGGENVQGDDGCFGTPLENACSDYDYQQCRDITGCHQNCDIVVDQTGADFSSIQAAVHNQEDVNQDGEILICVAPGAYYERVVAYRKDAEPLIIKSIEGPENTLIDVPGSDNPSDPTDMFGFFIASSDITIEGFKILDADIPNPESVTTSLANRGNGIIVGTKDRTFFGYVPENKDTNCPGGPYTKYSDAWYQAPYWECGNILGEGKQSGFDNVVIRNNIIDGANNGILVSGSDGAVVEYNHVINSERYGTAYNGFGIIIYDTTNSDFSHNIIEDNDYSGIMAEKWPYDGPDGNCSGTTVTYNQLQGNGRTVWIINVEGITFTHNNFLGTGDTFVNEDSPEVDAEDNYWGCPNGPLDPNCDSVFGDVDYAPWTSTQYSISLGDYSMQVCDGEPESCEVIQDSVKCDQETPGCYWVSDGTVKEANCNFMENPVENSCIGTPEPNACAEYTYEQCESITGCSSLCDAVVDDDGGRDFADIQSAVDDADAGDTICVLEGTYSGTIVVDKSLTLLGTGEAASDVIVNAPTSGNDRDVFQIVENDVTIQGFTIQGAKDVPGSPQGRTNSGIAVGGDWYILGSKPTGATDFTFGWWGKAVSGVTIRNNIITDNSYGVFLFHSQDVLIEGNQIHSNTYDGDTAGTWSGKGIEIYSSQDMADDDLAVGGDALQATNNIEIRNNLIYDNELFGIELNHAESWNGGDAGPFDVDVTISNNEIYNNGDMDNYPWGSEVHFYRGISANGNEENVVITSNEIYGHSPEGDFAGDTLVCSGIRAYDTINWIVSENQIHDNMRGIRVYGDSNGFEITGNTIEDNAQGIYVAGDVGFANNNNIVNNNVADYTGEGIAPYGVFNDLTEVFDATNNWWGDVEGPEDTTGTEEVDLGDCTGHTLSEMLNTDTNGDSVTENVVYCPWEVESFDVGVPTITQQEPDPVCQGSPLSCNIINDPFKCNFETPGCLWFDMTTCNARIDEEYLDTIDQNTMGVYRCIFTVETPLSMHGEYWVQPEARDLDGLRDLSDEKEYWFLNPVIALTLSNSDKLSFPTIRPGATGYSETLLVGNGAESGSGVLLDMFIAGTDFFDPEPTGAKCPTSNVLELTNFGYYAVNGAYSSADDQQTDNNEYDPQTTRTLDAENYLNIQYGDHFDKSMYNEAEILQANPINGGALGYGANLLSPGAKMALTFRLDLPEPCTGDFSQGSIFFWGEAV